MKNFTIDHAKTLYTRFCVIFGEKFLKSFHSDDYKSIWYLEWASGLDGIDLNGVKDALGYCKANLDWPPSLAEFRRLCEKYTGFPTCAEALQSAIRRDFNHPIIALAYEKVGSWTMKNDKESYLKPKFTAAYDWALNEFRTNPDKCTLRLEELKEKIALPAPPPITREGAKKEYIGFKERFKRYKEEIASQQKDQNIQYPVWDKAAITRGARGYQEAVFQERKSYLIGINESKAATLSKDDWYDRMRYLREMMGQDQVSNNPLPNKEAKNERDNVKPFLPKRYYDYMNN